MPSKKWWFWIPPDHRRPQLKEKTLGEGEVKFKAWGGYLLIVDNEVDWVMFDSKPRSKQKWQILQSDQMMLKVMCKKRKGKIIYKQQ